MMSMPFPYGNTNAAGQHLYGTAVCPNFRVNYNHYYASFHPNSDGLLSTPKLEQNQRLHIQEYPLLMNKNLLNNSSSSSSTTTTTLMLPYENKNDFLTFLEHKTKPISELNPFANEFSLVNNTSHSTKQIVPIHNEINSTYKFIFDDLIEQSLQSIDAIKKASKIIPVTHVATQCPQTIDLINRSTQTDDNHIDQYQQLEQHSSRTIDLMNNLLENFKCLLLSSSNKTNFQQQLKSMSYLFDELHYFILVINQILISNQFLSLNRNNLFSNMIKDISIQSSLPIITNGKEQQRMHQIISSTSQQIHPITMNRSKICLLCQRIVDDGDDVMHKLCRLLSSSPDTLRTV